MNNEEYEIFFSNLILKKNCILKYVNLLMYPALNSGKKIKVNNYFNDALKELELNYNKSKSELFTKAILNCLNPITIRYVKYGSITNMKLVYVTPERQLFIALNNLAKAVRSDKTKTTITNKIKTQIYNAYLNSTKSYAIKKKQDLISLSAQAN